MPIASAEQHDRDYAAFTDDIKRAGQFVSANRLQPRETAATVRVREGVVSVTDGPFPVIEATSMAEAIQVASQIPGARYGCVEVRPIAVDAQTLTLGCEDQARP